MVRGTLIGEPRFRIRCSGTRHLIEIGDDGELIPAGHVGDVPELTGCAQATAFWRSPDACVTVGDFTFPSLHLAVYEDDAELARLLLAAGADLGQELTWDTPLHSAVAWRRVEIVRLLLAAGANPNAEAGYGWTPLFHVRDRSDELVQILLDAGANPDVEDQYGGTWPRGAGSEAPW